MQRLMFLDCFVQKVSKKNLWGVGSTLSPGKGRINILRPITINFDTDVLSTQKNPQIISDYLASKLRSMIVKIL